MLVIPKYAIGLNDHVTAFLVENCPPDIIKLWNTQKNYNEMSRLILKGVQDFYVEVKSNPTPHISNSVSPKVTKKPVPKTTVSKAAEKPRNAYRLFCLENKNRKNRKLTLAEEWQKLKKDKKRSKELEKYENLAQAEYINFYREESDSDGEIHEEGEYDEGSDSDGEGESCSEDYETDSEPVKPVCKKKVCKK